MGNVLDCSSDPLDQIHEPDGSRPTEVGPGSDDARSQSSSHHLSSSIVGGDRRRVDVDGGERERERGSPLRKAPELLYLENAVPLRDSIMWKLQRKYYTAHHVQCWEKMVVPCFVTSNSFIAKAYARVLVGFMRDWFFFSGKADQSEPLLILEIGAGHGKFTCLVLQHLLEMREFLPTLTPKVSGIFDGDAARGGEGAEEEGKPEPVAAYGDGDGDGVGADAGAFTTNVNGGDEAGHAVNDGLAQAKTGAAEGKPAPAAGRRDNQGGRTGSGSGSRSGAAEGLPFRYVVTDVAQGTLDYVRCHPSMTSFFRAGVLEVALLDAEDPTPPSKLRLQVSEQVLDLRLVKNPVATVCNYVMDSLVQDAFRVKDHALYENRLTISATKPLPQDFSKLSLTALQGLSLMWDHRPYKLTDDQARAYYANAKAAAAHGGDAEEGNAGEIGGAQEAGEGNSAGVEVADNGKRTGRGERQGGEIGEREGQGDEVGEGEGEGEGVEASSRSDAGADGIVGNGALQSESPKLAEEAAAAAATVGDGADQSEGGRGLPKTAGEVASDSDFDELLASYLGKGDVGAEDGERADVGGGSFEKTGGSLLMPLGALRLLRHLSSLAGGRCLVLVGDKGYVKDEEMKGDRDPHIAYHGSLSCMVNMDALARYTLQRGGWSLSSPYMEGFKCQALVFGMAGSSLQETRFAFEDSTQAFGPESFSTLQRAVKDEVSQPSLGLVVQLLRLSRLDPDVFMKFRGSLIDRVSSQELAPATWEDVRKDTVAIAQRSYPLQQGKDVNFEAARLLMALKDFEAALVLFRRSSSVSGEHHVTCHNMGMSHFYLGKLEEAKGCFERSLELHATYEESLRWLAHVERSMAPPSLEVPELRNVGAGGAGSGAEGRRWTAAGLADASLNTLSI